MIRARRGRKAGRDSHFCRVRPACYELGLSLACLLLFSLSFTFSRKGTMASEDHPWRSETSLEGPASDNMPSGGLRLDFRVEHLENPQEPTRAAAVPRAYTFWSSDFHIGPIADLKDILAPLGVSVIDKSLSSHCHLKGTCATDLKVLDKHNGITLGDCPNRLRREFYDAYANDPEMANVDAFLCNHACGMCELFMPFNKSMVVVASTRYEIGRHDSARWLEWNENLRRIAANPRNLVAANNLYDAEYIRYFTGIEDVPVIPSYCGYVTEQYNPVREEVLVGPSRGVNEALFLQLQAMGDSTAIRFARIRDLYPSYTFSQLAQHPAIVLFPYQVSIMSVFEYYRMALPMFVPSPRLLTRWHLRHRILHERTWQGALFGTFGNGSALPCHPSSSARYPHDPNNEVDEAAVYSWIMLADFYHLPHIQTFDSFEDLLAKLEDSNLNGISRAMRTENARMKTAVQRQWREIIERVLPGGAPGVQPSGRPAAAAAVAAASFDHAMGSLYGIRLRTDSCVGSEVVETMEAEGRAGL